MKRPQFDHPVGHKRLHAHHTPGHGTRPPRIPPFSNVDPANYWRCTCGHVSRSWEAADSHTVAVHR